MIKAIETEYSGYLFRSRLEARWAVFFDSAGILWEYEPEGYETPAGRYLPDFRIYLRDYQHPTALFEVKPQSEVTRYEKCICPTLDPRWNYAIESDLAPAFLVACGIPSGDKISEWIRLTGGLHRIPKTGADHDHAYPYMFGNCECCRRIVVGPAERVNYLRLKTAFNTAASARFERRAGSRGQQ